MRPPKKCPRKGGLMSQWQRFAVVVVVRCLAVAVAFHGDLRARAYIRVGHSRANAQRSGGRNHGVADPGNRESSCSRMKKRDIYLFHLFLSNFRNLKWT